MANDSSWKCMACYENIRMTCFNITWSIVLIIIKPCRCNERSILPSMEDVDNSFTLCKGPFQSILIWDEPCFYDDSNVKKTLNCMLWKTTNSSTKYTQALNDFVESQKPFFNPNWWLQFALTWVVGFDWSWWMHVCTYRLLHLYANVFHIIMWMKLEFLLICP